MSPATLVKISTLLTVVGFLPAVVGLLRAGITMRTANRNIGLETPKSKKDVSGNPTVFLPLLPYALLTTSMSFFLFSFQVHEKTILLPLMPMTLLVSSASVDSVVYHWGVLFNNVAVFRSVSDFEDNWPYCWLFVSSKHVAIVKKRWAWSAVYCNTDLLESATWIQPLEVTFKYACPTSFYGAIAFKFSLEITATSIIL